MKQSGYVTELSNGKIKVRVIRESACGGNCASCKGCPSEIHLIECDAFEGVRVGDRVSLCVNSKSIVGGAAIGYILPTIFAIIGAVCGFEIFSNNAASIIGMIFGIAAGLGLAKAISLKNNIVIKAEPSENNFKKK